MQSGNLWFPSERHSRPRACRLFRHARKYDPYLFNPQGKYPHNKEKLFKSISENAKETNYSYITNTLNSTDSSISESISTQISYDFVYDTKFFTQELENFCALSFLSDGNKILKPQKIKLKPYFEK